MPGADSLPIEYGFDAGQLVRPPIAPRRSVRPYSALAAAAALSLVLTFGGGIVGWRLLARSRQAPVAYPDLATLQSDARIRGAQPMRIFDELRAAINNRTDVPLVVSAMSSGFIWNLPGQQRCILLLYQQDLVQPVRMHPLRFDVEVSQHLPDRAWMERPGAWLVRSFPDTAQVSNLPYYLEMPAVRAFIPLSADGKSYDTAHATIFPVGKIGHATRRLGRTRIPWACGPSGRSVPARSNTPGAFAAPSHRDRRSGR